MTWKDLFSAQSADYARFRPSYPPGLFDWLADVAPGHELAVDVGTGNGQAAVALAEHFRKVIGLEPSAEQLEHAPPHPGVEYRQAAAEATGLPDAAVDLLLAAQAFHWFARDAFFAETRRAVRHGGILALVCYGLSVISPQVDRVVMTLYEDRLGPYWEPERRLVETGYRGVAVPFPEIAVPAFNMRATWSPAELVGYLGTWSALARARAAEGRDPLQDLMPELEAAWDDAPTRVVTWPLAVRAFRLPGT